MVFAARNSRQLIWSVTAIVLATLVLINPFCKPDIPLPVGIMAWCIDLALVLILSAHPAGARIALLLAGVFMAVPCWTDASPLIRGMLMCFMAAPFLAAVALLGAPPLPGFRARLAYLCDWSDRWPVKQQARRLDAIALLQLIIATVVVAVAIAAVKAVSAVGLCLPVRWLAGGIMIFAAAEMLTAAVPLMAAACGVIVPPLMRSPWRSASIGEFWAERWNPFVSTLARIYFFMPLARRGVALAVFATFFVSAVAHVLVFYMAAVNWRISLTCGAFFLVQPLLIATERWMKVRRWRPLARHAWTLTALALISPLFVAPMLYLVEQSWGPSGDVLPPTATVFGFVIGLSSLVSLASIPVAASRQSAID